MTKKLYKKKMVLILNVRKKENQREQYETNELRENSKLST